MRTKFKLRIMSKKVKKQKKRNTKKFRKGLRKKSKSSKVLILKSRQTEFSKKLMKIKDIVKLPTDIRKSNRVLYIPSFKTLDFKIREQIKTHLNKYPIIEGECFLNGTLLSLKIPEIKTVHGYYGNTIKSKFRTKNYPLYLHLMDLCSNSIERYIGINDHDILDTVKKKIWYKHCWNKIGDVYIDMTVEKQRLSNNSFNYFMEYLECDSHFSSSIKELNVLEELSSMTGIFPLNI